MLFHSFAAVFIVAIVATAIDKWIREKNNKIMFIKTICNWIWPTITKKVCALRNVININLACVLFVVIHELGFRINITFGTIVSMTFLHIES